MTLSEIRSACKRIAALMGPKGHVHFYVGNEDYAPGHVGVGDDVVAQQSFSGASIEQAFGRALAYARDYASKRDAATIAGEIEFTSWFATQSPDAPQ